MQITTKSGVFAGYHTKLVHLVNHYTGIFRSNAGYHANLVQLVNHHTDIFRSKYQSSRQSCSFDDSGYGQLSFIPIAVGMKINLLITMDFIRTKVNNAHGS
jgi:hypothetical protein